MSLAEGREKAQQWRKLLSQGVDPHIDEERQRRQALRAQANTFTAVAEEFFVHIRRQRRAAAVEMTVRREFVTRWGERPIAEIDRFDVEAIIKSTIARGKEPMAHLLFAYARRLFKFAVSREYIERSPCERMTPRDLIGEKENRDRVLSDAELRALWGASQKIGYPFGPFVQVLALTGQRRSEVAGMTWSEIDIASKLWVIPRERMKAKAAHVVPLTDDVIALLESLPRFRGGDCVFSYKFGASPLNVSGKLKHRLDREMGVEGFVLHDIRRTVRTNLPRLRVPTEVAELVIGHTKKGLHKVYDQHAYLDEKREALDLWAKRLRDIVTPPPANVVPLRAQGE